MKKEIWKDIIGYEGLYQVSSFGRIRNRWRIVYPSGKIYLNKRLSKNGIKTDFSVHRLVCIAFHDNPENKPEVNHKDGNKQNNYDWNLEWSTSIENTRHSIDKGFHNPKGETNENSKLNEIQVREIREKYIPWKYSSTRLGKEYGVGHSTILRIINNKGWTHI